MKRRINENKTDTYIALQEGRETKPGRLFSFLAAETCVLLKAL